MTNSALKKNISASDVEKFGYCPLSWWLSEQKDDVDEEKLTKGTKKHEEIGIEIKQLKTQEKMGEESETSWIMFSLIAVIIGINGLAILYTIYAPDSQGQIITALLSIISVLWIIVAAYFFYMRLTLEKDVDSIREKGEARYSEGNSDSDTKKGVSEARLNTFFLASSNASSVFTDSLDSSIIFHTSSRYTMHHHFLFQNCQVRQWLSFPPNR